MPKPKTPDRPPVPTHYKRGDVRADGYFFYQFYDRGRGWEESWLSPEAFATAQKNSGRWDKNNPEKARERCRAWARANPDKMRERRIRAREKNRERWNAKARQRRIENPGVSAERQREARRQNPERGRESCQRYRQRNPHKLRERAARCFARKRKATPPEANLPVIRAIYEAATRVSKCLDLQIHVDHIHPLAKGGQHTHTNLQLLPGRINRLKGDRTDFVLPA